MNRGVMMLVGSFAFCPCHLPLTLGLVGALLGGGALGVAFRSHLLVAGLVSTAIWLMGTAIGLLLVRRLQRDGLACAPSLPPTMPTGPKPG